MSQMRNEAPSLAVQHTLLECYLSHVPSRPAIEALFLALFVVQLFLKLLNKKLAKQHKVTPYQLKIGDSPPSETHL